MLFKRGAPKLGKLFPAGAMIAREGDAATHLHIIQSGVAEVYRTGFDGSRIHLARLKAGEMFGIMALFGRQPHNSNIQALKDTWILLIDKKAIMRRIYEDPSLVLRILENLSERIIRQNNEILQLTDNYHAATGGLASVADAMQAQAQDRAVDSVAKITARLCEQLHAQHCFPEVIHDTYRANMEVASFFYDIGNAGLPEGLLTHKGGLEKEARERLKTHIHIGSHVLRETAERMRDSRHFLLAAELAQYHHERFDGSGYLGLTGDQIPVGARIISVVDVYTALISDRSYRAPLTPLQALSFVGERSGTHFDPQVTEAFVAVMRAAL